MLKGLYGLTGDPITYGHLDLIERAARLVGELWVVLFDNGTKKNNLLPKAERLNLLAELTSHLPRVQVDSSGKLLVDYALERGIDVNIRGLRGSGDLNYERGLASANASQGLGRLETIYLMASPQMEHISSSAARMVVGDGGDPSKYVPLQVKQSLDLNVHRRLLLGITGGIATGKSTIAKALVAAFARQGILAHHIDCDDEVRSVYKSSDDSHLASLRSDLVGAFGAQALNNQGELDPKQISSLVFQSPNPKALLLLLQSALRAPLLARLRHRINALQGLVLVEGTMIAEYDFLSCTNNQALLVTLEGKEQLKRLRARQHLSEEEAQHRMVYAGDSSAKKQALKRAIRKEKWGHLFSVDNGQELSDERVRHLAAKIQQHYKLVPGSFG